MELAIAHNIPYITNIEALTVLCSVVRHAKSVEKHETWSYFLFIMIVT